MTFQSKFHLAMGLLWLMVAVLNFANRNSPCGGTWNHYSWLLWAFGSAVWLWRFFNPVPDKPE